MTSAPETRYFKSGSAHIAYQHFGSGPARVVYIPGTIHHLEVRWDDPLLARSWRQFGEFCQIALFDRRGFGLTGGPVIPIAEQVDDVLGLMDVVGWSSATLDGYLDGGALALVVAAEHPERVDRLIVESGTARLAGADDYPFGYTPEGWDELRTLVDSADAETLAAVIDPGRQGDAQYLAWFARYWRMGGGPAPLIALMDHLYDLDLRGLLPSIEVETLVLHREGDPLVAVEHAEYLAKALPNAQLRTIPSSDHSFRAGDMDPWLGLLEEFITGRSSARIARRLASVLFTDIVGSTEQAESLGDANWRELLDAHDASAKRCVSRAGGELVKSTGDGILATFDDPLDAIECATALQRDVGAMGLEIRAGIHAGQLEVRDRDIGGIAVHIAARVLSAAGPGDIVVSRTVRDLVIGATVMFADRGTHHLKGVAEPWQLFAVDR